MYTVKLPYGQNSSKEGMGKLPIMDLLSCKYRGVVRGSDYHPN